MPSRIRSHCLPLVCLGALLAVAACTAPAPTTSTSAASETAAESPAPGMSADPAPGPQPRTESPARPTPAPKAPPMSDPLPPERLPSPMALDYSCRTDADCAVKNVGNCCGRMPACVNKDSPVDPAAVQAECKRQGLSSTCGFREIDACSCVGNRCSGQQGPAAVTE